MPSRVEKPGQSHLVHTQETAGSNPAPATISRADHAFDEAVKLARRIRILFDAGENGLALELYAESRALAVKAIELEAFCAAMEPCACGLRADG